MKLKIRLNDNAPQVISLEDNAIDKDLLTAINATGPVTIKSGFPPKTLELVSGTPLSQLGIRSGDSLLVKSAELNPVSQIEEKIDTIQNTNQAPILEFAGGAIALRKIPDDNSCLFNAIAYSTVGPAAIETSSTQKHFRSVVAETILSKPDDYSEAILGRPIHDYAKWIQKTDTWGGAIELQILAEFLNASLVAVDIESGAFYRFNDVDRAETFAIVAYSGVHYDSIVFVPHKNIDDKSKDVGVFSKNEILHQTILEEQIPLLLQMLKAQGYYTNTRTFELKCQQCQRIIIGEDQATEHAKSTGHNQFGQID